MDRLLLLVRSGTTRVPFFSRRVGRSGLSVESAIRYDGLVLRSNYSYMFVHRTRRVYICTCTYLVRGTRYLVHYGVIRTYVPMYYVHVYKYEVRTKYK